MLEFSRSENLNESISLGVIRRDDVAQVLVQTHIAYEGKKIPKKEQKDVAFRFLALAVVSGGANQAEKLIADRIRAHGENWSKKGLLSKKYKGNIDQYVESAMAQIKEAIEEGLKKTGYDQL
ncbi:hypothetical protein SP15_005 [Bacillus phage SP-15]|uniref:Uncharacterized protein n=1 Tax=Bacillus phage SP-15 TaxID=1792032 RepID=A0A127AW60_9CAUD|nr:hypothetical protein SP15_005 [Bacillus phage SP-15]AMM44803.1 hypothetical protein SP15_005 [Bacillus phage SP-15]